MHNIVFVFSLFLVSSLSGQDSIFTQHSLRIFQSKIDSIHHAIAKHPTPTYTTVPQSTADYIYIITSHGEELKRDLESHIPLPELLEKYPSAVEDKNLLITKNIYTNFKGHKRLEFASYGIRNNRAHELRFSYADSLGSVQHQRGDYVFTSYSSRKDPRIETFQIFHILQPFTSKALPASVCGYIDYPSHFVDQKSIFKHEADRKREKNAWRIVDSLYRRFQSIYPKPKDLRTGSLQEKRKKYNDYVLKKEVLSDSLYNVSADYRQLISTAIDSAIINGTSSDFLEKIAERHVSKSTALHLALQRPVVATCGNDNRPHLKTSKICRLAANLGEWRPFMNTMYQVLNSRMDYMYDTEPYHSLRYSITRTLDSLSLDMVKFYIGTHLRAMHLDNQHPYRASEKMAKVIVQSGHALEVADRCVALLQESQLDEFNKLQLYYLLDKLNYYASDPMIKACIADHIDKNLEHFDPSIRLRIQHANLEFKQMLGKESQQLDTHFKVVQAKSITTIHSRYYSGKCWTAQLKPLGLEENIVFDVMMQADTVISSVSTLCNRKDSIVDLIRMSTVFDEFLRNDSSGLVVYYINDHTYQEGESRCSSVSLPETLKTKYADLFSQALMLRSQKGRKWAKWILLPNGHAIITQISHGFGFGNKSFDDLRTMTQARNFGPGDSYSFTVYDKEGKVVPF